MKIKIKNRWDGSVLFAGEYANTREALIAAIGSRVILFCADLSRADLSSAILSRAKGVALAIARTRILAEGDLIGWKKVEVPSGSDNAVAKLRIPAAARRSSAFGRKCRAEYVEVLEAPEGAFTSAHGPRTEYKVGEVVRADAWDENWQEECSHGIHFFITREEAEAY